MPTILSTKKLTKSQKQPLLEAGFEVEEHDFIKIEPMDFSMPKEVKNAIFTSQNAVRRILNPPAGRAGSEFRTRLPDGQVQNCYCVGEKTKNLLEENGIKVVAFAEYGKDLAHIIVEKYRKEQFTFFCGNRRREELPSILKKNKVAFEEVEVYKTLLNPKHFEHKFDGILFFSPSGVKSYVKSQPFENGEIPAFAGMVAYCIGTTTAVEARKHTTNIEVAKEPTIESVINSTCSSLSN